MVISLRRFASVPSMIASYLKIPTASSNKCNCSIYFSWTDKKKTRSFEKKWKMQCFYLCKWFNVKRTDECIRIPRIKTHLKWTLTRATTFEICPLSSRRSNCTASASCKSTSNLPLNMLCPGSSIAAVSSSSSHRLIFRLKSVSPISAQPKIHKMIERE